MYMQSWLYRITKTLENLIQDVFKYSNNFDACKKFNSKHMPISLVYCEPSIWDHQQSIDLTDAGNKGPPRQSQEQSIDLTDAYYKGPLRQKNINLLIWLMPTTVTQTIKTSINCYWYHNKYSRNGCKLNVKKKS